MPLIALLLIAGGAVIIIYLIENRLIHRKYNKRISELSSETADLNAELDLVNNELRSFAYIISHDLKTPLRGIGQVAHWLEEDYLDILKEEGQEQLHLLLNRVNHMSDLIEGLLQYSRVGRVKFREEHVDFNSLVNDLIKIINPPAHFTVKIVNPLPKLLTDRRCVEQIFLNLLSNAIRFGDKPSGEIMIGCLDMDSDWRFFVSDNGPGIDKKYQAKIFQIFQKLKSNNDNIGIGLSVVKKAVEYLGGKIWLESEMGKNTVFFFTIPKHKKKSSRRVPAEMETEETDLWTGDMI